MTRSRRNVLKLGLGAGAVSLLKLAPAGAELSTAPSAAESTPTQPTLAARPLPLSAVRLLGGPLKRAQDADLEYLLSLEPDRMLASYRRNAGRTTKAEPYGGWDGGGKNLTGHIAGHYLSAVSIMSAATGNRECLDRARYIVKALKGVQDAHGDGYLSALDGGRKCFEALARGEIKTRSFDLNGEWSPWYTLHKTFAGLRDAYRFTGDAMALAIETKFAAWAERTLSGLSAEQLQRMMETEFGGMNEVLVDLFADTGDRRWLTLSYAFEHRVFIEPLARHQDDLAGLHANTQIPKLLGSAARFASTRQPEDLLAASFFFDRVAQHHSFATGGHGTDEYFGPPDHLGDRVDGRTAESCNVYNMLRLGRRLFAIAPDARYADFQERALFNHALASFDPDAGRMSYMVPVGPGVTHEYQDMLQSFTCCVGTGMENHALAGDGLYFEAGDRLWVNLYAPSSAAWSGAGARLTMDSDLPEGESARLTLGLDAPRELTLSLRRPYWSGDGFAVAVNGVAVATKLPEPSPRDPRHQPYGFPFPVSSYVDLRRTWRDGDVVEVRLPKTLRLEPTPDVPTRVAILWGPLVLAGDLGPEPPRGTGTGEDGELEETGPAQTPPIVPVLLGTGSPVGAWVRPVAGEPGRFRTDGVGREPNSAGQAYDIDLVPFYRLHRRTYTTVWDLVSPTDWPALKAGYGREEERRRRLDAATVAFVAPGDRTSEPLFNYQAGADATPQRMAGRPGRAAHSWFAYDLPLEPGQPMAIVATYYTADRRTSPATFEILVDGQRVAEQTVERTDPGRFFDVTYPLPEATVRGKRAITVRFQAKENSQIAAVYGVRTVRAGAVP